MAKQSPYQVSYGEHEARFSDAEQAQLFAQRMSQTGSIVVEVHARGGIIGQYADGMPTEEFQGRGDEVYPVAIVGQMHDLGLPPHAFSLVCLATSLKLTLVGSEAGAVRVFPGTLPRQFGHEGSVATIGTLPLVGFFLDGVAFGQSRSLDVAKPASDTAPEAGRTEG